MTTDHTHEAGATAGMSRSVYETRVAAMRALMEEHELDALIFTAPEWVQFATNYPEVGLWSWERPLAVVFPRQGEPFALFNALSTNGLAGALESGLMWVSDVTMYAEHPRLVDRVPLLPQWRETMADLLRAHGLGSASIGVDALWAPLTEVPLLLPRLRLVGVGTELRELRWVKHPEELDAMRSAAALSDWAQERYRESMRSGRLLAELNWSMGAAIMEEAARRHPGEHVELSLKCVSGPESAAPHGAGFRTDARIGEGDVIVNNVCVRFRGMWVENERTWFCGPPDDVRRRAFEAACEATAAGIDACRAGAPVCGIDAAAAAVFERYGYGRNVFHRTGHGLGLGGHEFPHDMAFNSRPLRANEVYSVEPGIYLPGVGGFRQDDTVVIGEEPEVLTTTPKDLEWLTIDPSGGSA